MSVAPSARTASAIKRSCGFASRPVKYAIETGRVMYRASRWRFAIHRRSSANGLVAAKDLLNSCDGDAIPAARRVDVDGIADAVADERFAQRGLVAHATRLGIGLRRPDDPVGLLVSTILGEADRVAHAHHAFFGARLDDHVVLDDGLELFDPSFHHSLLVFGRVVLEVLGKIPQLTRGFDLGDDRGALLAGELVQLLFERRQTLRRDVDVRHGS